MLRFTRIQQQQQQQQTTQKEKVDEEERKEINCTRYIIGAPEDIGLAISFHTYVLIFISSSRTKWKFHKTIFDFMLLLALCERYELRT